MRLWTSLLLAIVLRHLWLLLHRRYSITCTPIFLWLSDAKQHLQPHPTTVCVCGFSCSGRDNRRRCVQSDWHADNNLAKRPIQYVDDVPTMACHLWRCGCDSCRLRHIPSETLLLHMTDWCLPTSLWTDVGLSFRRSPTKLYLLRNSTLPQGTLFDSARVSVLRFAFPVASIRIRVSGASEYLTRQPRTLPHLLANSQRCGESVQVSLPVQGRYPVRCGALVCRQTQADAMCAE